MTGNGIGKALFPAAIGALLTFAGMYLVVVGTYVTRADVVQMIEQQSPYSRDAKLLAKQIDMLEKKVDEIDAKVDRLLERD
jgi:serine protease inhibitor ecotin